MNYFLKRILLFIPTFFLLSILIFSISHFSPTDPSLSLLENDNRSLKTDFYSTDARSKSIRTSLGLNKPIFYFHIQRHSLSDTLQNINILSVRKSLKSWSYQLASWPKTNEVYRRIKLELLEKKDVNSRQEYAALFYIQDFEIVLERLKGLESKQFDSEFLKSLEKRNYLNNYIPSIHWNGSNNQYHQWILKILSFDLGRSAISNEKVSAKISTAIGWTLGLSSLSLFISLLIAIPLAVYASVNPGSKLDRFCSTLFFSLYSLPLFWAASLLLIYFASVENFHWFPSFGVGELDSSMSILEQISIRSSHLTLPLICWTYGSLAFIYRQMRSKMIESLSEDYSLAAKAKGLSIYSVAWKHAFRNSSFPLITLLGASLPSLISGSFVIETIFSIPGMGKLTIDAFLQRDFPLIHSISLIACLLTIVGVFLADLAYYYSDPRIRYQQSHE